MVKFPHRTKTAPTAKKREEETVAAPVDDEILDVAGIAKFLNVKERWVYRSARDYGVPMHLVGGKFLRAWKSELTDWFNQQRVY